MMVWMVLWVGVVHDGMDDGVDSVELSFIHCLLAIH